jgi:2-polyprenyl-6-methoxyphenol hydroxylase-like FAD-dependent oxidoreductase
VRQEERQVGNENCVSHRTLHLQIPVIPMRPHFVGARVKVSVYPNGSHALFHGPRCYLVFGDALCGFSPRYGQGMSVAALESLALDECRAAGAEDLWRRFFARSREIVDTPWRISTGSDLTHPGVAYPRPALAHFICAGWLADKLGI